MDTERYRKHMPPVASDETVYTRRSPLRLPLDLSKWIAPEKLVSWISEEIDRLDPEKNEVHEYLRMLPEKRPKVMLSLLLYGYATQVFGSEEIVQACREHPTFIQLCEGKPVFPEELEQFRRKHRILLENLLAEILVRTVREKYLQLGTLPPGLEYSLFTRAVDRLDTARHMDTPEE